MRKLIWCLILALACLQPASAQGRTQPERISFRITTVETGAGERTVLSEALVDGPVGTDFVIRLNSGRFQMEARFLTDLLDNGNLRIRSRLHTKRFYGYSKRNLPLYEEDTQRPEMELDLDEAMALLPFGQGGGSETLSIEIVPGVSRLSALTEEGRLRPLEIDFLRNAPGGVISIEAVKIPHKYVIEAQVLDGDLPLFAATSPLLYDDESVVVLLPTLEERQSGEYQLKMKIREFQQGAPSGIVGFGFDLDRHHPRGIHPTALNWAGTARLGSSIEYDLNDETGRPLKLHMKIRLADE
jgi:hypothetical protein